MLDKIYLEITNVCNLDCTFCHKTARAKKLMSASADRQACGKSKIFVLSPDGRADATPSLASLYQDGT